MKGEDDVNTARKDEEADGSGEFLIFLYSESWLRVYFCNNEYESSTDNGSPRSQTESITQTTYLFWTRL